MERSPGDEVEKFGDLRDARGWLAHIDAAERRDEKYHKVVDRISTLYASLDRKASEIKDVEFELFWANLQVLLPSIYSRPPQPIVGARFKDRRPLPRRAAEVLERALEANSEQDGMHETLIEARNDLGMGARGVIWLHEALRNGERAITAAHINRRDFLHAHARKWKEVTWVARASYLTKSDLVQRFGETSNEDLESAQFEDTSETQQNDDDFEKPRLSGHRVKVWEIWDRRHRVVVWVSQGFKEVLDIREPYFDLEGFFPCPKPAYGTLRPESLTPVPDLVYYEGQLQEISSATKRIQALTGYIRAKLFYSAGMGDASTAIERAFKSLENDVLMVPVPDVAALSTGAGGIDKAISWMPMDMIAKTVRELIDIRRQLIEDVYEITGLSDIMRGNTQASETLGAQQLKSQYGTIRSSSRQGEMARLARDTLRIMAEMMAEHLEPQELLKLSQVDDLPFRPEMPEMMAPQGVEPEGEQQGPRDGVYADDVFGLLREQRLRPFVLEIETDSTIQPDEAAEKERRSEFLAAVGGFMQQALPVVQADPRVASLTAEMLRFTASGFRAPRSMMAAIDEYASQLSGEEQAPNPAEQAAAAQQEAEKAEAEKAMQLEMQKLQIEQAKAQAEIAKTEAETELAQSRAQRELIETVANADAREKDLASKDVQLLVDVLREENAERRENQNAA